MEVTRKVARRFISKVDIGEPNACWLWTACVGSTGYGHIGIAGKTVTAHRVAWTLWRGPIPGGLLVLHSCDVPLCMNPRHLWLGTDADNSADMVAKGRQSAARGEECHLAKLTADEVLEIYQRYHAGGVTLKELGDEYGVTFANVGYITRGEHWRHITAGLEA